MPAYNVQGVSLFSGISGGGSIVPVGIGVSLIGTGFLVRLVGENAKAAVGDKPDFGGVIRETLLCFCLLLLNGAIAGNVWSFCQWVAVSIYPDNKLSALASLMGGFAKTLGDYTLSLTDLGGALKNSAVMVVALFSWLLTLLAHWQLEVLQVCVYNVVYSFGPILIGLSLFGFGGRRVWFAALVEVSSWSITMAIVYRTIDTAMHDYLLEASRLTPADAKFIDVISLLTFMAGLPFVVPVVTGRLIGSGALGALGNVSLGGTMVDAVFSSGRAAAAGIGGSVRPGESDVSSHTTSQDKRPGD